MGILFMLCWMSQHLDTFCFSALYVLYFCICICSAQMSMFHMDRHSKNTNYYYYYYYLLTYLCPSLLVKHRPSTIPGRRTLFWAALVIPDQLVHCCFSSASVSRLQLLRGRPLFPFPCRFQVRAWRVVLDAGSLRVCPIQLISIIISDLPLSGRTP